MGLRVQRTHVETSFESGLLSKTLNSVTIIWLYST